MPELIEKIGIQNIVISILSIILLYVFYQSFSFSTSDNVDKKVKEIDQKVMDMSRQLNTNVSLLSHSFNQLSNSREMVISRSLYRAPYINVVNRRPITLMNTLITSSSESNPQPISNVIYGPFAQSYADPRVAPGAKRKWRLYAVYNDNLAPKNDSPYGFFLKINVQRSWQDSITTFPVQFKFGGTYSIVQPDAIDRWSRDGYSTMVEIPSSSAHGNQFSGYIDDANSINSMDESKPENRVVKLFYLELQALDVYEKDI